MVRSLTHDWEYPILLEFDKALSTSTYNEIIYALESIGIHILLSVSDQGPRNEALIRDLGITVDEPWSPNPFDPSRKVFFSFDFNHIFKNQRNAILDNITILEDGKTFSKKDLQELFDYVKTNGLSPGAFLKEIMITCNGSDRQTVGFAYNLMSKRTAALLLEYFDDISKHTMAHFFIAMNRGKFHLPFVSFYNFPSHFYISLFAIDSTVFENHRKSLI